jgi:arylsulfatase A-like enzyme
MISAAPWTVPSHASLFTGLYPREHGADNPTPVLRPGLTTMAAHLAAAGYATACATNNALVDETTGLARGFQDVVLRPGFKARATWKHRVEYVLGLRDSGAAATNEVIAALLGRISQPFFLFVNYLECHWNYVPPRRFERLFAPSSFTWAHSAHRRIRERRRAAVDGFLHADAAGRDLLWHLYDAELATVDDRVGALLVQIERAGYLDNSVVVITSDHGELLGEGGLVSHQGSLHQHLVHVPFLARIPGAGAGRIGGLVQTTDVFAGICGVLGVDVPVRLHGRPFGVDPFRLGPRDDGRDYAFSEWSHWGEAKLIRMRRRSPGFDFDRIPRGIEAVQDGRYKLVVDMGSGQERVYDLDADPSEQTDVSAARPDVGVRLHSALQMWRQAFPRAAGEQTLSPAEEEAITRRLRELGYL